MISILRSYWYWLVIAGLVFTVWYYKNDRDGVQNDFDRYVVEQQSKLNELENQLSLKDKELAELESEQLTQLQNTIESTQSELASANDVNKRMQRELTRLRNALSSAASTECIAATDTAILYTNMFGECTERLAEVARVADERGLAGRNCTDRYNSISIIINGG